MNTHMLEFEYLVSGPPCPGALADTSRVDEEFPDSELVCGVCREVLLDPVTLLCGHNFDRMCMCKKLDDRITACPTCRAPLPPDTVPKV